ncbi:MAG: glycerophosphodiester phosphodiesterase family protein [Alphaproteobacteria bacterium]|nr:glycerophosphodiester phosphodiesterase family protein [Alphaproteobacteria bacterium]
MQIEQDGNFGAGPTLGNSHVIAHRGGAANAPENTLAAFRETARLGVTWVEVDVSLLRDGTAVLFHDDTIERCTNGRGRILDCTFADLEPLDAGSWFAPEFAGERVPTLAQALAEAEMLGLSLNFELKLHGQEGEALVDTFVAGLSDSGIAPERTFVSSFDHGLIANLHRLCPELPRGLLFKKLARRWQETAEQCEVSGIVANHQRVGAAEIASIRSAGYNAYVYTVNDPAHAAALWDAGLTGVITDRPQGFLAP